MAKYFYTVVLNSEYWNEKVCDISDKYCKETKTLKEAIAYARSIKKELKEMFKNVKDNTITIDIDRYTTNKTSSGGTFEDYDRLVFSLYVVGRY